MKCDSHQAFASDARVVASTCIPTKWGVFQALGFEREILNGTRRIETALALVLGDLRGDPLVRIHSQCFTGEVLGSLRCDCAGQMEIAMEVIANEGSGLLIYECQEGRGIGLMAKLKAYALQDLGLDTVEANLALGFCADCRDFALPSAILRKLGIGRVRLLTNNPNKTRALCESGIDVVAQISCESAPTRHSVAYLQTKREKMGHTLRFPFHEGSSGPPTIESADDSEFATIEVAFRELRAGRMIVVVDDEDRENEGDLTMAAEMITPETISFMATYGRGLICLAMNGQRLDELELPAMVPENTSLGGTAFTVSIDVKGVDITTGISAHDRAATIRAAIDPTSVPEDFARPGHIFPLRAQPGGVLERRGHTEAAVDLASLAGLSPAGVICEIVNDDGTMARVPDLIRFCKRHNLQMITVSELARYRIDSLDDGGLIEAVEGFIPVCPKFSVHRMPEAE